MSLFEKFRRVAVRVVGGKGALTSQQAVGMLDAVDELDHLMLDQFDFPKHKLYWMRIKEYVDNREELIATYKTLHQQYSRLPAIYDADLKALRWQVNAWMSHTAKAEAEALLWKTYAEALEKLLNAAVKRLPSKKQAGGEDMVTLY